MILTARTWHKLCNKVFYPDDEISFEPGDVVLLHSWFVPDFFKKVRSIPCPIKLVTATGDAPLNAVLRADQLFKLLDEFPNITEWKIMQSWYPPHPRITQVQLGFHRTDIDLETLERLKSKPKKDAVYYNFTVSNKWERLMLPNAQSKSFEEYLEEMAGYKYAMCPMGVGVDTHKFYEAVAVGCIPIIKAPRDFLKTYDNKYNYVCLPGHAHCSYILNAPQVTEVQESVYVPERPDLVNEPYMIMEPENLDFKMTDEEAQAAGTKINSYGDYFKKSGMIPPEKSVIDHYTWLRDNGKCDYGGMSFLV